MEIAIIFVACFLFNAVQCFDSQSYEYNGIEVTPFYETIIYSDMADIMKELENNNAPSAKTNNDSESNEEVEDLLSEYHKYLEKAQKQRLHYLEKTKLKNNVPPIRHEKFTKLNSVASDKQHHKNDYYYSEYKSAQSLNPFSMFIPFNSNTYPSTTQQPSYNGGFGMLRKIVLSGDNPISSLSSIPLKSSCYCKEGRGSCKQCFMSLDHTQLRSNPNILPSDEDKPFVLNNLSYNDQSDDTLNIRIKVDVQIPKKQEHNIQFYKNQNRDKIVDYDTGLSREYLSAISLPSPYFDFPIPMNLFGLKRMTKFNNHDSSPMHKITIHKKKKSKPSNGSKKHRKKMITLHNIKTEPQLLQNHFESFNINDKSKSENDKNNSNILNLLVNVTQTVGVNPATDLIINANVTEENILLFLNITKNIIENGTNENHTTESSVEAEYKNIISNVTTDKPLHLLKKREIQIHSKSKAVTKKSIIKKKAHTKANNTSTKLTKEKIHTKYVDRSLPTDTELLYWPKNNNSKSKEISKNITAIILESEYKKEKLNMSAETLRRNHTRVLEQAIFGNVDWNDVDSVAPAFISFFGKYIEGILTFCSTKVCHSMKCTKKNCIHRVCALKDRFDNKGHCTGSNNTDSAASMESIMDLPSNIAFEIVDILQDRMLGKLYGKITLCISPKCITFAASKKIFHKNKCIVKELNSKGHCVK